MQNKKKGRKVASKNNKPGLDSQGPGQVLTVKEKIEINTAKFVEKIFNELVKRGEAVDMPGVEEKIPVQINDEFLIRPSDFRIFKASFENWAKEWID